MKFRCGYRTIVVLPYLWAVTLSTVVALPKVRLVPYGRGFDRETTDQICEENIWPHWSATYTNRGMKVPVVSDGAMLYPVENEIGTFCRDTRANLDLTVENEVDGMWNLVCDIQTEIAVEYTEDDVNGQPRDKGRCERLPPSARQVVSAGTTDCSTTNSINHMRYVTAWTTAYDNTPESHLVDSTITISEVNGANIRTSHNGPHVAIYDADLKSQDARKRQYRVCARAPPGRGQLYMHFAYSGL